MTSTTTNCWCVCLCADLLPKTHFNPHPSLYSTEDSTFSDMNGPGESRKINSNNNIAGRINQRSVPVGAWSPMKSQNRDTHSSKQAAPHTHTHPLSHPPPVPFQPTAMMTLGRRSLISPWQMSADSNPRITSSLTLYSKQAAGWRRFGPGQAAYKVVKISNPLSP